MKKLSFPVFFNLDRKSGDDAGKQFTATISDAGKKAGNNWFREMKAAFDKIEADLKIKKATGELSPQAFDKQLSAAKKSYNAALTGMMSTTTLTDGEIKKMSKSLKQVSVDGEAASGLLQSGFAKVAGALGIGAVVGAAFSFGKSLWNAATEAQVPWNALAGTLDTVGISIAGVNSELLKNSKQFEEHTVHDDEAYASVLQDLISISGDYTASIRNVTLVADLAAARHLDLHTAATLVGKVMVGETSTLKRYGVVVAEGTDALEAMRAKFAGMAENELKDIAGQQEHLNHVWEDAKEASGGFLQTLGATGPMQAFGRALQSITRFMDDATEARKRYNTTVLQSIIGVGASRIAGQDISAPMTPKALLDASAAAAISDDEIAQNQKRAAAEKAAREKAAREAKAKADLEAAKKAKEAWDAYLDKHVAVSDLHPSEIKRDGMSDLGIVPTPIVDQPAVEAAADHFKNPWLAALDEVKQQTLDSRDLFQDLGDAWANGGLGGIAKWASAKVKESLASAVSAGAHALFALARGNPVEAGVYGKSAVAFGASAAAWRGVAAFAGGASGGGGSSAALGGGGNVGGSTASNATPPGPEVNIYMDPLRADDPDFLRVTYTAVNSANELFNGAKVTVRPYPKSAA